MLKNPRFHKTIIFIQSNTKTFFINKLHHYKSVKKRYISWLEI